MRKDPEEKHMKKVHFMSAIGERPIRLSDETRWFAYESLNHKYGLDTLKTPGVSVDDVENFDKLTQIEQYDIGLRRIAEQAPIRICEGEKLSGAATLGLAIGLEAWHSFPILYKGSMPLLAGMSHITLDYGTVVKQGMKSIRTIAEKALEKFRGTKHEPFAKSCVACCDSFEIWRQRYIATLKDKPGYENNYNNLLRVPEEPATNFYEAVQSLWFTFAFTRLCGTWSGIGRIDYILGDYLKKDLADGTIILDEAREILAHFFIKGCEWVCGKGSINGDAQHYQNLVIGGIDENGNTVTNEVTYLVLDILEETEIGDYPTTVRLSKNSDEKLFRRVAEVIRHGGGALAVYDEDLILRALTRFGYSEKEARKFANDGCWEVQVPGKTFFSYWPFDSLQILQQQTLKGYDSSVDYPDFESLYAQYVDDLGKAVDAIADSWRERFEPEKDENGNYVWKPSSPVTLPSIFEGDCIERGLSYLDGGTVYHVVSPHIGGFADTVDSLYAIKKLVYDEKKLTLKEFLEVLRNNWEGNEILRQYVINRYTYYGSDNDEADDLAKRVLSDFEDACDRNDKNPKCSLRFPAGVSTFGRQLEWAPRRLAVPHGYKAGAILSGNCSPTPGTDRDGATAIIRSYCKLDLERTITGAALDVKLTPSSVKGEDGLAAVVNLLKGFVTLGGFFMQLDVADAAVLHDAQDHPEDHQTLSVRVSGWNARFVTLNKEWQDMIISQTENIVR